MYKEHQTCFKECFSIINRNTNGLASVLKQTNVQINKETKRQTEIWIAFLSERKKIMLQQKKPLAFFDKVIEG